MTHAPRSRFTVGRLIKWGLIAFVALIIIAIAAARMSLTFQVKKLEQAVRDRGEPLTFVELEEWIPHVPDASNAALAIIEIWADEEGEFWREWVKTGEYNPTHTAEEYDESLPIVGMGSNTLPWNESEVQAAREFLASRQEHVQRLRTALELPDARYPVHYQDGINMLLPHLANMKGEFNFLKLDALMHTREGRINEALDVINLMTRLVNTLHHDTTLIGQLVHLACSSITLNTATQILTHASPTSAQLDQLHLALEQLQPPGFEQSMITERVYGMSVFGMSGDELAQAAVANDAALKFLIPLMRFTGLWTAEKRLMLETYEEVLSHSDDLDYLKAKEIEASFDQAVSNAKSFPPKVITGLMLPALGKAAERFVRVETERQLTLLAIAIERYRRNHNEELPESLDTLDIELPDLPGLTIGYNPTNNGYSLEAKANDGTVYSVQILYSPPNVEQEPADQ